VIRYNFKSPIIFLSTEGQDKGFNQSKYETQILRGALGEICIQRHKEKQLLGEFCCNTDYFVVKDKSRVYKKIDTKKNKSLCNKARVTCYINSID
jgi:hypothetical protein